MLMQPVWHRGVLVLGASVSLDPTRPRPLAFVSRPDLPALRAHRRLVMLDQTAELVERLNRRHPPIVPLRARLGAPVEVGPVRLTALRGGNHPGNALLLVEYEGERLLYASRPQVHRLPASVGAQPCQADHLVVVDPLMAGPEAPTPSTWAERLASEARAAMGAGYFPVWSAARVGDAVNAYALLRAVGLPVELHPSLEIEVRAMHAAGVDVCAERWSTGPSSKTLLLAPHRLACVWPRRNARVRLVDGAAFGTVVPGLPTPRELVVFARRVGAVRVWCAGAGAQQAIEVFEREGIAAAPLGGQLPLPFGAAEAAL